MRHFIRPCSFLIDSIKVVICLFVYLNQLYETFEKAFLWTIKINIYNLEWLTLIDCFKLIWFKIYKAYWLKIIAYRPTFMLAIENKTVMKQLKFQNKAYIVVPTCKITKNSNSIFFYFDISTKTNISRIHSPQVDSSQQL